MGEEGCYIRDLGTWVAACNNSAAVYVTDSTISKQQNISVLHIPHRFFVSVSLTSPMAPVFKIITFLCLFLSHSRHFLLIRI
uniref:Uncharacterized protein n=1 Tax=Mastacembelus armatus TaxID=205130 RepID=A0A7N8Y1K5_9TELE